MSVDKLIGEKKSGDTEKMESHNFPKQGSRQTWPIEPILPCTCQYRGHAQEGR